MLANLAKLRAPVSRVSPISVSVISRGCASKSITPVDEKFVDKAKTHTGQKFEEGDYRMARFLGVREKQVNTQFAIDLIAEQKPIAVKGRSTYCDGGDGPLGHPRVYINLDKPGNKACRYCGLRFYQEHHH